jgi:AhpD family alkylhydroperoxidase
MKQVLYKKKYTVREFYDVLCKGIRTYRYLKRSKKHEQLSIQFIERIMLAVTEVNGCEVCSYAHTKIALEQGMSEKEIKQLLSGTTDGTPAREMKAILFAQHYADTKGNPTKLAFDQLLNAYGEQRSFGILGAIRMIMIGNSYGIALSAFKSRLKGKSVKESSLFYEIRTLLSIIPLLPVGLIHAFILNLLKLPLIEFKSETDNQDVLVQK